MSVNDLQFTVSLMLHRRKLRPPVNTVFKSSSTHCLQWSILRKRNLTSGVFPSTKNPKKTAKIKRHAQSSFRTAQRKKICSLPDAPSQHGSDSTEVEPNSLDSLNSNQTLNTNHWPRCRITNLYRCHEKDLTNYGNDFLCHLKGRVSLGH